MSRAKSINAAQVVDALCNSCAFEEQLGSCFSTLESLQAQTSTLPAMKSLLADMVKASAKNGDVSC